MDVSDGMEYQAGFADPDLIDDGFQDDYLNGLTDEQPDNYDPDLDTEEPDGGDAVEDPAADTLDDVRPAKPGTLDKSADSPPEQTRGEMLQSDYTRKMQAIAEQRRELAELIEQAKAVVAQKTEPAVTNKTMADIDPEADPEAWVDAYKAANRGKEPTQTDYLAAVAKTQVSQIVAPLKQQFESRAQAEMATRLQAERDTLIGQFPEADSPEVMNAIAGYLQDTGTANRPGCVEQAFWALFGREVAGVRAEQKQEAVEKHKASAPPSIPPQAPQGRAAVRPTSNMDAIAARQKADPKIRSLLRGPRR